MSRSKSLPAILCALSSALLLSACAAIPGYDPRYDQSGYGHSRDDYYVPDPVATPIEDGSGVVRCESIKGRSQDCRVNGRARLIRQLSDTPCEEGKTWGQGRNGVWVTGGCRAEFVGEGRRRHH